MIIESFNLHFSSWFFIQGVERLPSTSLAKAKPQLVPQQACEGRGVASLVEAAVCDEFPHKMVNGSPGW